MILLINSSKQNQELYHHNINVQIFSPNVFIAAIVDSGVVAMASFMNVIHLKVHISSILFANQEKLDIVIFTDSINLFLSSQSFIKAHNIAIIQDILVLLWFHFKSMFSSFIIFSQSKKKKLSLYKILEPSQKYTIQFISFVKDFVSILAILWLESFNIFNLAFV